MNRFRAWGLVAAFGALAAGATAARAADPPLALTTDDRPWYKKLFFSAPAQPGPVASDGAVAAVPGVMHSGSALPPEMVQEAVKAESAAWQRRMAVCLKLREAAIARNDEQLLKQVDELEYQATAIYKQRVGALGVPKTKAPLPPAVASSGITTTNLLPEKPVDPQTAAGKLMSPGQPVPVGGSASLPPGQGYREVNP